MRKAFYPRLALQNCLKNGKFYFPYLLTIVCTAAAFYICTNLAQTPWASDMLRYSYLTMFMQIGVFVLGLFSFIFLIYTNSFLMKRRVRELGLYNVLGMGKRNLAVVLSFETLYTWITGVGGGILVGMLLQRLVTLLAQRLMRIDSFYTFRVSLSAMLSTLLFFGGCLGLTLLGNLRRLHVQNPAELLRGGQVGERQPKTRWLLALLGVLTLGGGYGLAVMIKNPVEALAFYFVAVVLVIIGTYCLFSALSVLVLKLLRGNKRFFYKTGNFIGVSGMLHRMNRNAVGLGNICILSTMVMVMISSTLSLFVGTGDALNSRYPAQINTEFRSYSVDADFDEDLAAKRLTAMVEREGAKITRSITYTVTSMYMTREGDGFDYMTGDDAMFALTEPPVTAVFLTVNGYNDLTGENLRLKEGELLSTAKLPSGEVRFRFAKEGETRTVSYKAETLPMDFYLADFGVMAMNTMYFVLPDRAAVMELAKNEGWAAGRLDSPIRWRYYIDTDADAQEQQRLAGLISDPDNADIGSDAVSRGEPLEWDSMVVDCREGYNREEFYAMNGGFFFLGIFLGFIFIVAMALIMYYRQISEGYEDRERFRIMQQVGLNKGEIRKSINAQVLIVFFAPLLVAGVHVAFDFNLVRMLLTLFSVYNGTLTALCTLATFGAFALIYALMYLATARTYYNIVSE